MNKEDLKSTLLSFGAFVPEKFDSIFSEKKAGEEVFREYPFNISLSTGGLYAAIRMPVDKYWAMLVKQHFTNIKNVKPKSGIEMNNKAFGYSECGFYRDFNSEDTNARIIDPFGIDIRKVIKMYESSLEMDPKLWEPHYNIASHLTSLYTWCENPKQDNEDQERTFNELNTVLELDPKNIPARLRLAGFFRDYVDPVGLLNEVLELDSDNQKAKEELKFLDEAGWRFEEHSMVALDVSYLKEKLLLERLLKESKSKNNKSER
jgi:hypothetical protein